MNRKQPTRLRSLTLRAAPEPGRPAFISAASGLVVVGNRLYVIADDELHLGVFPATGSRPGTLVQLLPGALPSDRRERKARKADFEVLLRLPRFAGFAHGALLALGSGSRPNRRLAVLTALDRSGAIAGPPASLDSADFYARLERRLGSLNVEGAVIAGSRLCLLNRGHPRRGGSACAWMDLKQVLEPVATHSALAAAPMRVKHYDLGRVHGVPLGFTDATALPGGSVLFTAVAERAKNSYEDGPCAGAAIGILKADGGLGVMRLLHPAIKVEGVALSPGTRDRRILLVTDADDASIPAQLYAAEFRGLMAPDHFG